MHQPHKRKEADSTSKLDQWQHNHLEREAGEKQLAKPAKHQSGPASAEQSPAERVRFYSNLPHIVKLASVTKHIDFLSGALRAPSALRASSAGKFEPRTLTSEIRCQHVTHAKMNFNFPSPYDEQG